MSMYRQLPTSPASPDVLSEDSNKSESAADPLNPKSKSNSLSPRLCFALCALCTLINLALSFLAHDGGADLSLSLSPSASDAAVSRKDIHLLRRPSQFIRFNEIERPSPPEPKQFNNYPTLLAQIDSADASKVFPDDPRRYLTHVGSISPEDRRVLVSETISTIIQFRAIDWGMETCELRLSLPSSSSLSLLLPSQSLPLSLYRLNATAPLDVSALSHNTRPPRIAKVGDVRFAHGESTLWHRKFACAEEEVLSFELACAEVYQDGNGEACRVEWWQNKEHPDPAVFLTQYATK